MDISGPAARACILGALLLLVAAAYLLVEPLERPSADGPAFRCGSAVSPPRDAFAEDVCGQLTTRQRLQVASVGTAALVLGVGGVLAFGGRGPATSGGSPGAHRGARRETAPPGPTGAGTPPPRD